MANHFKMWVWVKACHAWTFISNYPMGFEDRSVAYKQGFYAGYLQAIKDINDEGIDEVSLLVDSMNEPDELTTP